MSCPTCPARLMADLLEALGDGAKAAALRAERCSWWWSIQEENENGQTRTREVCGAAYLPAFLKSMGLDLERAAGVVCRDAGDVARAVGALAAAVTPRELRAIEVREGCDEIGMQSNDRLFAEVAKRRELAP